jgi:hypothetical protein
VILTTLNNTTQGELQRYENNYSDLNLITTALGRNVYDRVSYLEIAHDIWLKLCNTCESSFEIKSSCMDTYNRQYQTFSQKPGESLDDCFARFGSIMSILCSCGPLAYSDNERAKQLLYALDNSVLGMKTTVLEESTYFATLDTENYLESSNVMNCLVRVILTMMLLLLVRLLLLVLVLVVMMLPHHHCLIFFGVCFVFFGRSFW